MSKMVKYLLQEARGSGPAKYEELPNHRGALANCHLLMLCLTGNKLEKPGLWDTNSIHWHLLTDTKEAKLTVLPAL